MDIDSILTECQAMTKADVLITTLGPDMIFVSVVWPETQTEEPDFCHGQNTILKEAYKVLNVLNRHGWEHCEHAGRKDMGHSGGMTYFACKLKGEER